MLRDRLLTVAVGLPLLVLLVCYAPPWLFGTVLLVLTAFGLYEYFSLVGPHLHLPVGVVLLWGLSVAAIMLSANGGWTGVALVVGLFVVFSAGLLHVEPSRILSGVSLSLLGVIYVGFLLPHLAWVRRGPDGIAWVIFVLLVAMVGDSAGYAAGRLWGRHKLIPQISPGKTVEGTIGTVLSHLCVGGLSWLWLLPHRSLVEMICLAVGLGFLAQTGDLCESALKRAYGAKDSGLLFPGHGGVLDRIDSLLFPAAFIYYYVTLWS